MYGVNKFRVEKLTFFIIHIYNKPQIVIFMWLAASYRKFYTFIIYTLQVFKCLLIVEGHFVGRVQPKIQGLTLTWMIMTWSPRELGYPLIYYDAGWDTSQNFLASWLMVTSILISSLQKHKLVRLSTFRSMLWQLHADEVKSRKKKPNQKIWANSFGGILLIGFCKKKKKKSVFF